MKETKPWGTHRPNDQARTEAAKRRKELEIKKQVATCGSKGIRGLNDVITLAVNNPDCAEDILNRYRRTAALTDLGITVNIIGEPVSPLDETQKLAFDRQLISFNTYLRDTTSTRMTVMGTLGGPILSQEVFDFINSGGKSGGK